MEEGQEVPHLGKALVSKQTAEPRSLIVGEFQWKFLNGSDAWLCSGVGMMHSSLVGMNHNPVFEVQRLKVISSADSHISLQEWCKANSSQIPKDSI